MYKVKQKYPIFILVCPFLLSMVFGHHSLSQVCTPQKGFWNDYTGELKGQKIQLSYFTDIEGRIIGQYRFIQQSKMVYQLKGKQKGCELLMAPDNNNESAGRFRFVKSPDSLVGNFDDADGQSIPVMLRLQSSVGGTATQRYNELFGTTAEVETFAQQVRNAFVSNNTEWLAAHCRYPLIIYLPSRKKLVVNSKQQFITNFKKCFSQAYRDKFKNLNCYNMFSNHLGAMLGKGEIWLNHTKESNKERYAYCISTINVF
jgi:hypothetical protein